MGQNKYHLQKAFLKRKKPFFEVSVEDIATHTVENELYPLDEVLALVHNDHEVTFDTEQSSIPLFFEQYAIPVYKVNNECANGSDALVARFDTQLTDEGRIAYKMEVVNSFTPFLVASAFAYAQRMNMAEREKAKENSL